MCTQNLKKKIKEEWSYQDKQQEVEVKRRGHRLYICVSEWVRCDKYARKQEEKSKRGGWRKAEALILLFSQKIEQDN